MNFELAEENKKLRDNLKKMRKQLSKIKIEYEVHKSHIQRIIDFNSKLNPHLDLDEISELFFDFLFQIFSFEKGILLIVNKTLKYSCQVDFYDQKIKSNSAEKLRSTYENLFNEAIRLEQTFLIEESKLINETKFGNSCMITPIWFEGEIIGVVILENSLEDVFSDNEKNLIDELIHNVGKVLYNAMLFSSITTTAFKDEKTGVYSKNYFFEVLVSEIERVKRHEKSFSLIIADIDDFKSINKKHGFDFGDNLLKKIAYSFQSFLRGCDTVSRYSGDKFIFLLPDTDLETAEVIAERVIAKVQEINIVPEPITVSLGLTEYSHSEDKEIKELLVEAEDALLRAKKLGKNKFISYRVGKRNI